MQAFAGGGGRVACTSPMWSDSHRWNGGLSGMLLRCIVVANTGDFHNGSIVDDGSLNLLIYQSIDLLMSSYIIIIQRASPNPTTARCFLFLIRTGVTALYGVLPHDGRGLLYQVLRN